MFDYADLFGTDLIVLVKTQLGKLSAPILDVSVPFMTIILDYILDVYFILLL